MNQFIYHDLCSGVAPCHAGRRQTMQRIGRWSYHFTWHFLDLSLPGGGFDLPVWFTGSPQACVCSWMDL